MSEGAQQSEAGRQGSRLGEDGGRPAQAAEAPREDEARTAGRGFVLITGAKLWFMVMGAVVNIGLPIVMSPADFGVYSVVLNAVSLINMVVITGTIQAVSKLVSERPEAARRLVGRAALLQWFVGVPIGLAYIFGADVLAGWLYDASLGPMLRVSGGVILAYGFYAIFVGCLNGLKAFGRQAALDVIFSTLKTALIVGAVAMGFGVMGALWGFVLASVLVTGVAGAMLWAFMRRNPEVTRGGAVGGEAGKLLSYLLLVMLYTFCVNGVLRADLFLLKALVGQSGGLEVANKLSGVYSAMLNVSRLPYQAVIAVTFVIFPMISRATFEQDLEATRAYIRGAMRYSLILLGLLSALLAGNAQEVVLALYGEAYAGGAVALMVLSLATVGFALFFIATTMITGAGRPLVSVGVSAVTLLATAGFNWVLIRASLSGGVDEQGLVTQASVATAAAMMLGFGLSVLYLVRRYGAGLSLLTSARVTLAAAAVIGLSMVASLPAAWGRVGLMGGAAAKGVVGAAVFLGVLWLTREFGAEDRDRLNRVLRRGRKASPEA